MHKSQKTGCKYCNVFGKLTAYYGTYSFFCLPLQVPFKTRDWNYSNESVAFKEERTIQQRDFHSRFGKDANLKNWTTGE